MKCPMCGKENTEGGMYCECGWKLTQQPEETPQPTPQKEVPTPLQQALPQEKAAPPVSQPPSVPTAKLQLPDGSEIVLSEAEQLFGKKDVARCTPKEEIGYVSREHFRILREGDKFYILDGTDRKPSTGGTVVSGKKINNKEKVELKDSDEINMADAVKLTFKIVKG